MKNILNKDSNKVLVQGLGRDGSFQTEKCIEFGTEVVAGVHPTKAGENFKGIPIFGSVDEAVSQTSPDIGLIFVPAPFASDAIIEQVDAGIETVVCITEGIPVNDMLKVNNYIKGKKVRLIGPNCPGIITPGENGGCKVGIMPGYIHAKGRIGIISKSGTLTYEAVAQTMGVGEGQTTCIGIGGDPISGTGFIDCLAAFEEDPETEAVVMIGEIGGTAEEDAAAWAADNFSKPIVGFVAGATAPPGKRMGHAGAIISGGKGTADEKFSAFEKAGIHIARDPSKIGEVLVSVLIEAGLREP